MVVGRKASGRAWRSCWEVEEEVESQRWAFLAGLWNGLWVLVGAEVEHRRSWEAVGMNLAEAHRACRVVVVESMPLLYCDILEEAKAGPLAKRMLCVCVIGVAM